MPKMSDAFPSKYLKADEDIPDLNDGGVVVTVDGAEFERIGQGRDAEDKIILTFKELSKGLVLNKTNANTLTKLFGSDDTDDWIDRRCQLYSTDVEFKGEMVRGIRVSTRQVRAPARPPAGGKDFDEFDPPPKKGNPAEAAAEAMDV